MSQNVVTDTTATCVAYWKKGDVKNLQIIKESLTLETGKQKKRGLSSYEAILTVLDSTETGYKLEWAYKPNKSLENLAPQNKLNDLFLNLKIIYAVNETGSFDSLINYDEIKEFMQESINEMGKLAADKTEFDKVILQVKSMFGSRERIEQLVLREIVLYHSPYGVEYSSTNPQKIETELPNVLGGDPFPALLSLALTKIDMPKDLAIFTITQEIDRNKAATILNIWADKLGAANGKPLSKEEKLNELQITDKNNFEIILSSGWVSRVYSNREVKTGDTQRIETCEIKIK